MYDIFISYRREGGYEMAKLIKFQLQSLGFEPFLDYDALKSGNFDENIYNYIDDCKDFIVVLPQNAFANRSEDNDWVAKEIKRALLKEKNIITAKLEGFEWPDQLPEGLDPIRRKNWVSISREYFNASMDKLVSFLESTPSKHAEVLRHENTYFSTEDKKEVKRLRKQRVLLKQFDQPIYDKLLSHKKNLTVLDVGSNDGSFVMDRIVNNYDVSKVIGLEYDEKAVDLSNEKYGVEGKIKFYVSNVESPDFKYQLEEILEENEIEGFDVINASMILLHLKNPYKVLRNLRKFLNEDGYIIIKDIDDGLNIAYPDENKAFERVFDICLHNDTAGFRHSGRQIYTNLRNSGYQNISLEKMGLSTINMSHDDRSTLFDIYFSFIMEDLKIMIEKYPNSDKLKNDLAWYEEIYDSLEERFQEESFYFNLGFVIFTATK